MPRVNLTNRSRQPGKIILALIFTLVVIFVALEIGSRVLTISNRDGQRFFLNLPLRPFHVAVEETRDTLARYQQTIISELVYDPQLGWTNRPSVPDYNAAGMRADRDYALDPPDGVLRIALFGDSFTHGNEVTREQSWAAQLESLLNRRGIKAEVLNFGVGGYGIDQAYLRWQLQGRQYQPDIVLLGFVAVDVDRMVSLYWKFQPNVFITPGANPFTKPRFVLDGDTLRLINSPTVQPDHLPDFLANFPNSDLAPYEAAFDPDDYQDRWWLNSNLLAIIDALHRYLVLDPARSPAFQLDLTRTAKPPSAENDGDALAAALIQQWADEASADGSRFMIVDLPLQSAVAAYQADQPLEYQTLLDDLSNRYEWIETLDAFPTTDLGAQFSAGGHYSPQGNRLIAERIADYLAAQPMGAP